MKTKVKFKDIYAEVDCENNKIIFSGLRSDTESFEQDEIIKFYLSKRHKFFSNELIEFLNLTGIDWTKENEVFHYPLNEDVVIVEGWYDIIGKVLTTNTMTFYWESDSCTTNISLGGREFRHGILGELKDFETFRLDFAVVIPKDVLSAFNKVAD